LPISKISLKNKQELNFIADFLRPYTKRAYLVGGSVRDLFLGLELKDLDIEIYDLEPRKFEFLMQKLGAKGYGKNFFVYKFRNYDLALARSENKTGFGHRAFEVAVCQDEKTACKRRDFTMNALMINIFNYKFLDFYGGLRDLKSKTLRHINAATFQEDSLRVLRAVYFVARFNFKIADESIKLMQSMDISDLSRERINAELYKFFQSPHLSSAYKYLQELNLEQKIFGFKFEDEDFIILLAKTRKFIQNEALFLYLYLNYFNIDKEEFFKITKLKKEFLKSSNQAFFLSKLSDFDLAQIAFTMPLKFWLGLWNTKRIQRAKKLGLYDKTFQSKIKAQELLDKGFCGEILGLKLKQLRQEELKLYLKNIKKG